MTAKRKIIQIDEEKCDGCGACVPSCAEGAIRIVDGKARLIAERYCDGLGACLGECPRGALKIIEREAEEFDEISVAMACGCPSALIHNFAVREPCSNANEPVTGASGVSALSHWPVQIRLVPPTAPFLQGADLLVAADCTPVAYPRFHDVFLKRKVVLVGCPKFDDTELYIKKFADIFRAADIRSVTVLVMEVPCCQGLPLMVKRGMEMAGRKIPLEKVVIGRNGDVLKREFLNQL